MMLNDILDITNIENANDLLHRTLDGVGARLGKGFDFNIKFLPKLADIIIGMNRGEMNIIAARSSNGKSAMAISMALDFAKQGHKIHFFSLEMTKTSIMERIISNIGRIDSTDLLDGSFYDDNKFKIGPRNAIISSVAEALKNVDFTFSDSIGKTFQDVESVVTGLKDIDIFFLDYIQLVKGTSGRNKEDIDEYIKNLRNLAIKKNIGVVICSQINRAGANCGIPNLHEMKGTGCLEEVADKALILHWPWFYAKDKNEQANVNPNEYAVRVSKNRTGRIGTVKAFFLPEYSLITDADKENQQYAPKPKEVKDAGNNQSREQVQKKFADAKVVAIRGAYS